MADNPISKRLREFLNMAVAGAVGAIEGLPADETTFIPGMMLLRGDKYEISVVMRDSNAEAVKAARSIIQQDAHAIDCYAITYSVNQTHSEGVTWAVMLEVGEKGAAYQYVQPFRRIGKKVELLTNEPIFRAKNSALI